MTLSGKLWFEGEREGHMREWGECMWGGAYERMGRVYVGRGI